jgi:hypothetical protein
MGAILAGTMRAPLTGMVFACELTGDWRMLLPLLVACAVAHAFTVLVMRRSILTEKVARRGYHLTREYAIDPLEVLFVRDVMDAAAPATVPDAAALDSVTAFPDEPLRLVVQRMAETGQTVLAVVERDEPRRPAGVVTLAHLLKARQRHLEEEKRRERTPPTDLLLPWRAAR